MVKHIHILTSKGERLQRIHLMNVLAAIWRETGSSISFGDRPPPHTDVVISHTDYSVIGDDFFGKVDTGLPVINCKARNILKTAVSQMLIDRDSTWSGPVIVKTNANAHAGEEYAYHRLDLPRLLKILAGRVIPWQWTGDLPLRQYPILDSIDRVPGWVWRDDRFVVERFMPERDGDLYVLRLWMFFGNKEYCMRVCSELPIVKSRQLVSVDLVDDVPDQVREIRRKLGLDFGKIDFVMHDGKPLVFDVNKTPTVFLNKSGKPGAHVRGLADGLEGLIA
ncbi:MAG: hypothetical protein AAFW74_05730 [Pseudomonadota bacterium]